MYRDFKTTLELITTVLDNADLTSDEIRRRYANMPDRTFKRHMAIARNTAHRWNVSLILPAAIPGFVATEIR